MRRLLRRFPIAEQLLLFAGRIHGETEARRELPTPLREPEFVVGRPETVPFQNGRSLEEIWDALRKQYFPDLVELGEYRMYWSTRGQKRVLASCNIRTKRIRVARELLHPDYAAYLEAVVYHEMCHAVLGYERRPGSRKRIWHGRSFRELEAIHPGIADLDRWIKTGGWSTAVRRDRSIRAARARRR